MSSNLPSINLGELSKPATALVEKIAEGVGGFCAPFQVVRMAKAEAKAELVRAQGQIEVRELKQRAIQRFVNEEAQKQFNMEEITRKALPHVSDDAKPDNMENDWIVNFFDKCRLISDDDMQQFWAKVLAGEANAAGTFTKRTVNQLASMDKFDAEAFTRLCSFLWFMRGPVILLINMEGRLLTELGITFDILAHLDVIGLIHRSSGGGTFTEEDLPKVVSIAYFDKVVRLELPRDEKNELELGIVLLTKSGKELARVCKAVPHQEVFERVTADWTRRGFIKP